MIKNHTSKEKKEEYIRILMSKAPLGREERAAFNVYCMALKEEDLAKRKLNKRIIYNIMDQRGTDFACDVLLGASNTDSVMKEILNDVTPEMFYKRENDGRAGAGILKTMYRRGKYTDKIEAKNGMTLRERIDNNGCMHDDRPAVYFRL